MTKQNYKVNENNRTIVADIANLNDKEREEVQMLCGFGYTFVQEQPKKTRKSATKKMAYYEIHLHKTDYELFKGLCKVKNLPYSSACLWANVLIEMGKANNNEAVDTMRKLVQNKEQIIDCINYAKDWRKNAA